MSVTPAQLLQLANRLAAVTEAGSVEEVALRCSTSRAYYAALHAADDSLPADLAMTLAERRGKSSHQAVIDKVVAWSKAIRPGRTEAIFIARNLTRLKDLRKQADYATGDNYSESDAQIALSLAREILDRAGRANAQATA